MPDAVTTPQLKAIHVCKRELALTDETYRDFLQSRCQVTSAKDLTRTQATALLRYWSAQLGRTSRRPGRDERLPNELITNEMSNKIQVLLVSLGYDKNTGILDARNIIKNQCGKPWPQTRMQANKVIEGLKAMHKRGWRAKSSEDQLHA